LKLAASLKSRGSCRVGGDVATVAMVTAWGDVAWAVFVLRSHGLP
jgi:hypothetical protein